MALISHIVKELAESTGTAEKSITVIARWLREDGLLSQKGRGRGAAQATPLDAARLLIALMVGGKMKNAPQAVRDFGQLVSMIPSKEAGGRKINLENLCGLPDGHTFEEGLAALIGIWENEDAMRFVMDHRDLLTSGSRFMASLDDHNVRGSIHTGYTSYVYEHPTVFRWIAGPDQQHNPSGNDSAAALKKIHARYQSGIESKRSVSDALLRSLGEAVAQQREPDLGRQQDRKSLALIDAENSDG